MLLTTTNIKLECYSQRQTLSLNINTEEGTHTKKKEKPQNRAGPSPNLVHCPWMPLQSQQDLSKSSFKSNLNSSKCSSQSPSSSCEQLN